MAIKNLVDVKKHLFICNGGTCKLNGAEEATAIIRSKIYEAGLTPEIHTTKTLCNGRCKDGPVVISMPEGVWFKQVLPSEAATFVDAYVVNGEMPYDHVLYLYGSDCINAVDTEQAPGIKTVL